MSILVNFKGEIYWFMADDLSELDTALAPLHHCDSDGKLIVLADSYAHVMSDGQIFRYRQVIGRVSDLRPIQVVQITGELQ